MLEAQRDMAHSQCDVARSFYPLLGDLDPWNSTHVVLEAQRVMAGSQCDVTRFFYLLSGCFGAFVWALQKKATSKLSQRWQA